MKQIEYSSIGIFAKKSLDTWFLYKKRIIWISLLFFLPGFWIRHILENIFFSFHFLWEENGIIGFFFEILLFSLVFFISVVLLQPFGKIILLITWKQKEKKDILKMKKEVLKKVIDSIFALFLAKTIQGIVILFFLMTLFLLPKNILFWVLFLPLILLCGGIVFYLETIWCFVLQAVVLEDKKGWQALESSHNIVKGNFLQTAVFYFGIELLQVVFYFLLSVAVSFFSLFFIFFSVLTNSIIMESIITFFKSMTVTSYGVLFLTIFYCHQKDIFKKDTEEFDKIWKLQQ